MSTTNGLADLLFGRTRGAILAPLYGHADQSFYTRRYSTHTECEAALDKSGRIGNPLCGGIDCSGEALTRLSDFEHSLEVREDACWALKMSASHRGQPMM